LYFLQNGGIGGNLVFAVIFLKNLENDKTKQWRKDMSKTYKILGTLMLVAILVTACAPTVSQPIATPPTAVPPTAMPPTQPPAPTTAPTTAPTAAPTSAPTEAAPTATSAPTTAPTAVPPTPAPTASGTIDCGAAKSGDQVTVIYQWTGNEEALFNNIIAPFVATCGVKIVANSTRDAAVLDTAVKSTPPDVLFWPSTSPLSLYTAKLQDLTTLGVNPSNYADYWIKMGTVGGKLLALPAKADIKTIIWYSPAQFTANGYTVPTTLDELNTLVEKMVANGQVPWAMGFESGSATGWTGSDFIQDLLLAQKGPDYVNGIIDGSVPYGDPGVLAAYQQYFKWASDAKYTVGGANGTLNTGFADALLQPFSDPPKAMMVKQSGFAGGNIAAAYTTLKYGTDYAFFGFPGAKGVQGGADFMYAFSTSAAAKALLSYLTGPIGAANWAAAGLSLDPNKQATGKYIDPQLQDMAKILASTTGFTPDIGDTIPAPFGTAEWTAIVNTVQGKEIQTELNTVADAQKQALGK
jgi:alpha-glucoside transport system substrate-binding protein